MFNSPMLLTTEQTYEIPYSVRFDGSADYMHRTPGSAGNRKTWTFSTWVKRSGLGSNGRVFDASFDGVNYDTVGFNSSNQLVLVSSLGGVIQVNLVTTRVFRDTGAYMNISLIVDTTQATSADRVKLYINGVQETVFSSATYPALNYDFWTNAANVHDVGRQFDSSAYFNGYITETVLVDGLALDPTYFGEFDSVTGSWKPKKPEVSNYGTNGFWLDMTDTANLGRDASSGTVLVSPTPIGNMSEYGGLAAAFDGITNQVNTACAWFGSLGGSTDPGWIGAHVGPGSNITSVRVYASNNDGYVGLVGRTAVLELYGNTINDTATATKIADIGSALDAAGLVITKDGLNVDRSLYPYLWVRISTSAVVSAGKYAAEVQFITGGIAPKTFTLVSLSAADAAQDTPTNNFCTLNPLTGSRTDSTVSNNNSTYLSTSPVSFDIIGTTLPVSAGKYYAEFKIDAIGTHNEAVIIGITTTKRDFRQYGTAGQTGYSIVAKTGQKVSFDSSQVAYGPTSTTNDYIQIAFDLDVGKIWFGKNGTWMASGDPSSGANPAFSFTPVDQYLLTCSGVQNSQVTFNNGSRGFTYPVPTGFGPISTNNHPTPLISSPSKNMDVVLYTGNGASQSITGLDFQPDLVWIKSRSAATDHAVYDSVRGVQKRLETNTPDVEATTDSGVTAFNSAGFSVGSLAQVNTNTATYVAWCWKAGGAAVANTDGTIASQVSANPTAGFSVVTWTGTGAAGTIGHGLGAAPAFMITGHRAGPGDPNWTTYHSSIGATKALYLNLTNAQDTNVAFWNNTAPTSSVFSVGINRSSSVSDTYVGYCWAEIPGYSKFGAYIGNGLADGPFVYCGFRPRWIMIKSTSTGASHDWSIYDTVRDSYNLVKGTLFANLTNIESTGTDRLDITSTGFKCRQGSGNQPNINGETYIFAAFAEYPLGGEDISEGTAR